jgi:3-hydroxyisobutyrate dehydrogenase
MTTPRVALLGLGLMGQGMAARLLSAGFPLTVYNRNPQKAERLKSAGALVAQTPREAATRAEVVISMVADDVASRAVWQGDHGALAGAAPGTVLIESSTLSVEWVDELAAAAAQHQCEYLDAPVTGTKPHAAAGQLLFLAGGSARTLAAVRPVLEVMSRDVVHLGAIGSATRLKLINNFMCGVQAASLAEAMSLIDANGLDLDKSLQVLTNGAAGSPLVKTLSARATARDFTPNFMLAAMVKDLTYALDSADRAGITLQTAVAARALFQHAVAAGFGEKDFSSVIEALRKH